MYAKMPITAQEAAIVAATLEPFARTAPHFAPQFPWRRAWGPFAQDRSRYGRWISPNPAEQAAGIAACLAGGDSFGWTTTHGNTVRVVSEDDNTWTLIFDTSRHALHERNNGVGAVFRALMEAGWVPPGDDGLIHLQSLSTAPWYVCGVTADREAP